MKIQGIKMLKKKKKVSLHLTSSFPSSVYSIIMGVIFNFISTHTDLQADSELEVGLHKWTIFDIKNRFPLPKSFYPEEMK